MSEVKEAKDAKVSYRVMVTDPETKTQEIPYSEETYSSWDDTCKVLEEAKECFHAYPEVVYGG